MSQANANGKASIISALLKGENTAVAVLIIASGGINLWCTNSSTKENRYEIDRAREQINQIHSMIDDFERRQNEELAALKRIEEKLGK